MNMSGQERATTMKDTPDAEILYEVIGTTGVVTFNRPQAHNALTFAMYDRLGEICATVPDDGSVRAIIITGAGGRAFGAGTDISLFRDFKSGKDGLAYEARMEAMFAKMERCPVPVIAAIPGVCTGGAAVIAAAIATPLNNAPTVPKTAQSLSSLFRELVLGVVLRCSEW